MKKLIILIFFSVIFLSKALAQVNCSTADCSDGSFFSVSYCITTPTCGGFTGDISATVTTTMPNCVGCVEVLLTGTDNPNTRTTNVNISSGGATAGFSNIPEGFYVLTVKTPIVPTPPIGSTKTSYVCSKLIQINSVDTLSINATLIPDPCPVIAPYQGRITGVSASGGTAPYTYDWLDISGTNNTPNRTGLQPGVPYTLTVRDVNGCTKTQIFIINEDNPTVSLLPNGPICDPVLPRSLVWTATPEAGWTLNPAGSYSWNGGVSWTSSATSPAQNAATYGVYTQSVIFRDINDCRANATANVTLDTRPVFTAVASPTSVCPGTSSTVTANLTNCSSIGGVTCVYSFDAGATTLFPNSNVFTTPLINRDTTIIVRVTNGSGCFRNVSVAIDTAGRPRISYSVPTICPNAPYTIITNCIANCSGVQFNFNNNGFLAGSSHSYTQPIAPIVAATTTFPLQVRGANNCQLDTSVTVRVFNNTLAISSPLDTTICANNTGSTVTLTATGFMPFTTITWSTNPAGLPFDGSNANPIQAASPNSGTVIYTVTGTDINGCFPRIATQEIVVDPKPIVNVTGPVLHCEGTTSTLLSTGGVSYNWYNVNYSTLLSSPGNSFNVTPVVATTYNVIGTDDKGCIDTFTYVLPFKNRPTGTAALSPATICAGNSTDVMITATSPLFNPNLAGGYSINDGVSFSGTTASPFTFPSVGPFSTTTVINTKLRDDDGCISVTIPVTLTVTPFNFRAIASNPTCSYSANASITINNLTGGTSPNVNYSLNGGATTSFTTSTVIPNLASNTYQITVFDNSVPACSHDTTVVIATPSPLVIDTLNSIDVICNGDLNGSIPVSVTGGNPNFTYYLNSTSGAPAIAATSNRTPTFSNLGGGVYDVIVVDSRGCQDTVLSVPIIQPASITAPNISDISACYGTINGSITIDTESSGGWGGFIYTINTTPTQSTTAVPHTFTNLGPAFYTISVRDARGCNFNAGSYEVTSYPQIILINAVVVSPDCNNNAGSLTVNGATGGVPPYTFTVNGAPYLTGTPITSLGAGSTQSVQIICSAGCLEDTIFEIRNTARSMPIVRYTPPTCPGGNDAIFTIDSMRSKNTSTPPYTIDLFKDTNPKTAVTPPINLATNTSTGSIGSLTGGRYVMNLSDGGGCNNYPVDSFVLYTAPSTFSVVKASYLSTQINNDYAKLNILQPAGFTTSSIALASDINQSTGSVIIYNLSGGTPLAGPLGKDVYQMSIDNPNAFVNKVLKDTLGNQTYVSFSNLSPGPHAVFIRDANGCLDTLLLEVPGKFFIPNLVSPNGDFKNDVFEVVSLPDNSEVRIFNRWGDRVFESKNYDNKYDFAGLSDGVYYYDLEFDTGTRFKGWVQVIR